MSETKVRTIEAKATPRPGGGVIMPDRGHLDNNPITVTKEDIIKCLGK